MLLALRIDIDGPLRPCRDRIAVRRRDALSVREAMLARFARNFNGVGVPKSEAPECLYVRMFIASPARGEGVMIRLDLPVLVRCEACAGHRATALPQCRACSGLGFTASEQSIAMFIGDESPQGATLSLVPLGIHNFYLHAAVELTRA